MEELARRLTEQGLDPAGFLKYAPGIAATVCPGDEASAPLAELAAFAALTQQQRVSEWSAFHFGVEEIAQAFPGDRTLFLELLAELGSLVQAIGRTGISDMVLQRLPPSLRASAGKPWMARAALRLATEMAGQGADPAEAMRQAFPAIAATAAGADPDAFSPVANALREVFVELDAHGVSPTWPIAVGVVALARAFPRDPVALASSIREMGELALAMQKAGHIPHPAIEYGLTAALRASEEIPWLGEAIFPLAFAIVAEGEHPGLALQRMESLRSLDPQRAPVALRLLHRLAQEKLDVARLLPALPGLSAAAPSEAEFQALGDSAAALLREMKARNMKPARAFEEGLAYLLRTEIGNANAGRALELARTLTAAGIDPGPVLEHGLVPALDALVESFESTAVPALAGRLFDDARSLVAAGANPWRLFGPGVFSGIRIGGRDPAVFAELLSELRDTALDLARAGLSPDDILMSCRNLAIELTGDDRRALFSATLARLRNFAPALAARGFDPRQGAGRGLVATARLAQEAGTPWIIPVAAAIGLELADAGIDPEGMLDTGIPAVVDALGGERKAVEAMLVEIVATARAMTSPRQLSLERVLAQVSHDAPAERRAEALGAALQMIREAAAAGRDASAFAAAVVPVLARQKQLPALLRAASTFAAGKEVAVTAAIAPAFAAAASVAGADPAALPPLLESARSAAVATAASEEEDPGGLFHHGAAAAAAVAGTRPEVFRRMMARMAERVAQAIREKRDLRPVFLHGTRRAAQVAAGKEEVFFSVLEAFIRLGDVGEKPAVAAGDLLQRMVPLVVASSKGDAGELIRAVEDIIGFRDALPEGDGYYNDPLRWFERMSALVHRVPEAWRGLIVPTMRNQAVAAGQVFGALERLQRWIEDEEGVALLKHVLTQEGVRAPEILWGLMVPGLELGRIRSLSEEREVLLAFLRDVPIIDPAFYENYRRIVSDPAEGEAGRKTALARMKQGLIDLAGAVVSGEVPVTSEDDPLLPHVLFHVFPPAVSVTREKYLALFKERKDHPEHADRYAATPMVGIALAKGGYRIAPGKEVDPEPWKLLQEVVRSVHAGGTAEEPMEAMGQDLFNAWIEGTLPSLKSRTAMLERIYRRYRQGGKSLPTSAESAEELLAYREFLADITREIVQEGLRTVRAAMPDRYNRLATAKLTPRPHVGPGLVRAAWSTLASLRSGEIDAAVASSRLERQLKAFDLSNANLAAAADPGALEALLRTLPARDQKVELGTEHQRIVADLAGAELAAMQRELFGDGHRPGKLEYRRDAAVGGLRLELQVTKRRAHVPVGFCEGVCTAVDEQLWDRQEFAQVVIWGPDKRARGGMHLLSVDREGKTPALALPGINPSLELLAEAGAEAVLQALTDYATRLARENGFGAVWIPNERGILSNRGPIHSALMEQKFPQLAVPETIFSYSPYRYTFREVLVVWEGGA